MTHTILTYTCAHAIDDKVEHHIHTGPGEIERRKLWCPRLRDSSVEIVFSIFLLLLFIVSLGNPVTGVGYSAEAKKEEETPRRQRVPPGGFSSKLW